MAMNISFEGRKVIVTGGSRGIGRSIALAFAQNGADLAICARGSDGLKSAEGELRRHGGTVFGMSCDVGDGPALVRFITEAAAALGGIDILVNNTSGIGLTDDETGWLASINVDLLATVRASRTAVPFMETAGGGSIVNISSIFGLKAVPRALPYAAVKAALLNYTMGQALALSAKHIRVNAIAPGAIEFPGGVWDERKRSNPELYRATLAKIPWGRFGGPEEVAKVALFLASDMAGWVTGQTIVADGGQSLN
jgi:3-oxoacyl-[acyl-carrier protein] reductase